MPLAETRNSRNKNYADRFLGVLGAKGVVLSFVLVAVVFLSATEPELATEPVFGALVAVALGGAVALDTETAPGNNVDTVGLSLLVAVVAYTAAVGFGTSPGWLFALGVSALVLAATAYEYLRDPSRADPVGAVVAGALVVYTALRLTGWTGFAHSSVFAALVLSVGAGFVAVSVRKKPVEPDTEEEEDDELHRLIFGVVNEVSDVSDEDVRKDIASKMRLVAGNLEGVKIPTEVEDDHGGVPVALSEVSPDARHEDVAAREVVGRADAERLTGYVVHGGAVLMFRNGTLFKAYSDGEFGHDTDSLNGGSADAAFFSLGHMRLNDLDDLTPTDEEIVTPEETENETVETTEDVDDGKLKVGGDEIDIDEMFEKADEIIEDLSD